MRNVVLIKQLKALAKFEHDDHSVALEAAEVITTLRRKWFQKGVDAVKHDRNKSGCCCTFEEDGSKLDSVDKAKLGTRGLQIPMNSPSSNTKSAATTGVQV